MAITKTCSNCGDPISNRSRTGMCKLCRAKVYREENKEVMAAKAKVYREENKEVRAAKAKVYREENKEAIAVYDKAYRAENIEAITAYGKVYNEENKEAIAAYGKVYNEENKERRAAYKKVYQVENKEAIAAKKKVYHREHPRDRRTYLLSFGDPDCYVWNNWFEGAEGHHLAWNEGIYIPKDLHRSVRHNLRTGEGMQAMETAAMEWLHSGEIPGSKYVQTSLWDIGDTVGAEASV